MIIYAVISRVILYYFEQTLFYLHISTLKFSFENIIAKVSPSFSFSWAELVFRLDFAPSNLHPPTNPSREVKFWQI